MEPFTKMKKKSLAEFKSDKFLYFIYDGKFGNYINVKPVKGKAKGYNVSLPKNEKPDDLTLEKVEAIIEKHWERKKSGGKFGSKSTSKPTSKPTSKKTKSVKKPVSKKVVKKGKKKNIVLT